MSISSALSNAISGLSASARSAGVVSSNLANVLTEGYAPREIELRARADRLGGGVVVGEVQRKVNAALLNERRLADSDVGYQGVLAETADTLERALGTPDAVGSLSERLSTMEASLVAAAARPEETVRLRDVAIKADSVARKFNEVSDTIQAERARLDTRIDGSVKEINSILARTERLNRQIVTAQAMGQSSVGLQDQRQALIDDLASFVPLRLASRNGGAVAIYTQGGAMLLDGKAAQLSFQKTNTIQPHMTAENGLLSGLSINDRPVETGSDRGAIAGGALAGLFKARDALAPTAQAGLDALARDLVERFQQAGLDPTLSAGQPGLFTDQGSILAPNAETGLAGRISLNALVDDAAGGHPWRLRDGLGASTPGPVGDATLLQGYSEALARAILPGSSSADPIARSLSEHTSALASEFGQKRLFAERDLSFASALQAGLKETELEQGVDSDEQLQHLLLIEQAYAANARMVQTIDDLIDTLIRI